MYDFQAQHPEFDWSKYPVPVGKPFVVFIVTRNPKDEQLKFREPWVFNLDHVAGTFDHFLRYQIKGYEPVGYGNLLPSNPAVGITSTGDNMSEEHAKIKAHIDQILQYKSQLFAKAKAEVAEEDRKTIEARVEVEVQKLLAQRLEEERKKREELEQAEKELAKAEAEKAPKLEADKAAKPKVEK
jgi:hypothetical protein